MIKVLEQLSDYEALNIANQMMDDLMQASTEKNYVAHIQHFLNVRKVF